MTQKFLGQKQGMTQFFDEKGNRTIGTVILIRPNYITQVKTKEKDGYCALQIGTNLTDKTQMKWTNKAQKGHFAKAGVSPCRYLMECRIDENEEYKIGEEILLDELKDVEFIDVRGTSIGKGFQGVMKLHNFKGGPAAHGSGFHRHAGSTGMRSTPGRCLPQGPRASRMGGEKITVQNLKILYVDLEKRLLVVKGAVPGPRGSLVCISSAVKKKTAKTVGVRK